jgi:CheY-like chemotaxis protein
MPNLDGFGVVRKLRESPASQSLPVIALTANAMQGDRERVLAAGFTSYIAKPVSLSALRKEIEGLLV